MDYINQRNTNLPVRYSKEKFQSKEEFQQIWNKRKIISDYNFKKNKIPLLFLISVDLLIIALSFLFEVEIIALITAVIINSVIFTGLFLKRDKIPNINNMGRAFRPLFHTMKMVIIAGMYIAKLEINLPS
jgi:hypothetical protein